MKAITEQDRIAARALAKRLVKELEVMEWHRRGNESEVRTARCRGCKSRGEKFWVESAVDQINDVQIAKR